VARKKNPVELRLELEGIRSSILILEEKLRNATFEQQIIKEMLARIPPCPDFYSPSVTRVFYAFKKWGKKTKEQKLGFKTREIIAHRLTWLAEADVIKAIRNYCLLTPGRKKSLHQAWFLDKNEIMWWLHRDISDELPEEEKKDARQSIPDKVCSGDFTEGGEAPVRHETGV
tara:strand:+ start:4379 stop:4894 length:516 start_codon:yes stop_codon:yes gene_type:complete